MNEKSTEFGSWSLAEIIEGRYFRVPEYQRGYAWGERQLAEFWEDLCAVVASRGRHYTGAITVEELDGIFEIVPRKGFVVVDGQQRLTTVAILFSALNPENNPFLIKTDAGSQYVFSYGAHNADQQFLCRILSGNGPDDPENSHQRNLKNALGFFRSKVECLDTDQRRKIANAVMLQMTFDFRILGSEYSAGIVFETMNNRGKPLTLLEKLKNRLMYLVNTSTETGDEEATEAFEEEKTALSEEINEAWGSIYRLLALNPQVDPLDEDEYVAAHLSVYRAPKESMYSRAVAEARLFKMFCMDAERYPKSERIAETDAAAVARALKEEKVSLGKIRDYVSDLVSFAEPWAKMHDSFSDTLGRCRLLSGSPEVKIFLAAVLLHVGDDGLRKSIFEKAEQILFRNTVKGVMDEATFATLARRLHGKCLDMLKRGDNEQIDANGIDETLRNILEDERRRINAGTLVDFCADLMTRQQSPYGFYGWRGLKYFLFKQERDGGLAWSRFDDATLEHVMPQSATADNDDGWWTRQVRQFATAAGFESWDDLSVQGKRACRQCKRNLVNSLGNFVLLTQSENASVSDDPWERYPEVAGVHREVIGKKAFYADPGRTSSSGARRVARVEGSWNAFQIRERGRELFRKLAVMLGITGDIADESIDLALGFSEVNSLEDSSFDALPAADVNRLAPRIGSAAEGQRRLTDASKLEFLGALSRAFEEEGEQGSINEATKQYFPENGRNKLYFEIRNDQIILILSCRNRELRNTIRTTLGDEFSRVFSEIGEIDYTAERNPQGEGPRYIRFKYSNSPDVNNRELLKMMVQNYLRVNTLLNQNGMFGE